jgi:hypothetical protein
MATAGSIIVNLVARTEAFEAGMKRGAAAIDGIENRARRMRFNFEPSRDIYRQMATREQLEEQLYRATHSKQQLALHDHDSFYERLRSQWAGNERMMTLITATETAERKRIMESYGQSAIATFIKIRAGYLSALKIGIVGTLGLNIAAGIGDTVSAFREKGAAGGFEKLVESIPLIGGAISRAAESISQAITQAEAKERQLQRVNAEWIRQQNVVDSFMERRKGLENALDVASAPAGQRYKVEALIAYRQELERINELAGQWHRLTGKTPASFEELKKLAAQRYDMAVKNPFEELNRSLERQLALLGMTSREAAMYDASLKGFNLSQLSGIESLLNQIEESRAVNTIAELNKGIEEQIQLFGMSAREAELQRAVLSAQAAGVDTADIETLINRAEANIQRLTAMEKAAAAKEKLFSDAQSVYESTRTPLERYESQIGRLHDMLEKGAIDWDTYSRAVAQAREQLEKQGQRTAEVGYGQAVRPAYMSIKGMAMGVDPSISRLDRIAKAAEETANNTRNTGTLS